MAGLGGDSWSLLHLARPRAEVISRAWWVLSHHVALGIPTAWWPVPGASVRSTEGKASWRLWPLTATPQKVEVSLLTTLLTKAEAGPIQFQREGLGSTLRCGGVREGSGRAVGLKNIGLAILGRISPQPRTRREFQTQASQVQGHALKRQSVYGAPVRRAYGRCRCFLGPSLSSYSCPAGDDTSF